MKIKKTQLVASILIFVIALGMIGTGVYGLSGRSNAGTFETLNKMRAYSVMSAAVRPIMDKLVKDASDAAYDYAKDQGMTRNQRSAYVAEQEAAARVDAACRIALTRVRSPRYAHLRPILQTGQDRTGPGSVAPTSAPTGYVRGADYYAREATR